MTDLALPHPASARISPGHLRALPDSRLSRLAAEGDERAFTAIVRRHEGGLYRYCLAILGHREDAGDAAQATLTKALLAIPAKKPQVPLKPWLYRIAHNEAISIHRRRAASAGTDEEVAGTTRGADEQAFDRDELRQLVDDLLALPERQRAALVMRELSGLEYPEIGTSLGTSAAAAKQTVYEARLSLYERTKGREMSCARIRQEVSEGDRRALRGRRVAAHLHSCAACRDFERSIHRRGEELQALAPIGGLGFMGVLKGLIGGSSGSGGGGGALAALSGGGATVSSAAALKSAAALATLLVATGAVEIGHQIQSSGSGAGGSWVAPAQESMSATPALPHGSVDSWSAVPGSHGSARPRAEDRFSRGGSSPGTRDTPPPAQAQSGSPSPQASPGHSLHSAPLVVDAPATPPAGELPVPGGGAAPHPPGLATDPPTIPVAGHPHAPTTPSLPPQSDGLLGTVVSAPGGNGGGNSGHTEAPGNSGHTVAPGNSGHTDPPGNSGHTDPPGNSGHTDPPGNSGHIDPPGNSGHIDPPGNSGHIDPPGNSGHIDPPGNSGHIDPPGNSGHLDPPGNSGHIDPPGNSGHIDPPGNSAPAQEPGNSGHVDPPGNSAPAQEPGNSGHIDPPGNSAHTDPPGNSGHAQTPPAHGPAQPHGPSPADTPGGPGPGAPPRP